MQAAVGAPGQSGLAAAWLLDSASCAADMTADMTADSMKQLHVQNAGGQIGASSEPHAQLLENCFAAGRQHRLYCRQPTSSKNERMSTSLVAM